MKMFRIVNPFVLSESFKYFHMIIMMFEISLFLKVYWMTNILRRCKIRRKDFSIKKNGCKVRKNLSPTLVNKYTRPTREFTKADGRNPVKMDLLIKS